MKPGITLTENAEIIARALSEARAVTSSHVTDISIGFAEGIIKINQELFTAVWCAVISPQGDVGIGGGLNIKLPKDLEQKLGDGFLEQDDLERFIQQIHDNPYEILVRQAILNLKLT